MRCLGRLIVTLVVLAVVVVGVAAWGYSTVETEFGGATDVRPDFKMDPGSVASAALRLLVGDWASAAGQFIDGVDVSGTVTISNGSFVPLFIPEMRHRVYIGDGPNPVGKPGVTKSVYVGPKATVEMPFSFQVSLEEIPRVLLDAVYSGGNVEITIESTLQLGAFSISRRTHEAVGVANSVSSVRGVTVSQAGFTPNPAVVGQTVGATLTLSGGMAGTYTVEIWRDIPAWPDEIVSQFTLRHDGNLTRGSGTFTPSQADSYHLGLVYNGGTVWSQPAGTSRLTVSSLADTLTVNSYSFAPDPATVGSTVTVSVTISGGDAGSYEVGVWRDIDLWPDEEVGQFTFTHDGSTTTGSGTFVPAMAGTYHLGIVYGTETLWSQPNDSSRLTVTAPPTAFAVNSYSFAPDPATVGNTVTVSVTISGGASGSYRVEVWKDIDSWPDEKVSQFTFNHDGPTTTGSGAFVPGTAGSYHLGIVYGAETLWSQPNDSSRLTVAGAPAAFAVNSYSFAPDPAVVGNTVTVNVTISGGSAGSYQVEVWKDIDSWPDEKVSQFVFSHDGSTTTGSGTFVPTAAGTYHLGIVYGSETLWSQPNDSSRLTVTAASAAFAVSSYSFAPDPAVVGNTVTVSVTVSGGSSGSYRVEVWRDVDWWPDEKVGEFTFSHDGSTATGSSTFVPAIAATYHLIIVYGTETLWSQPNDSSRLTVS